MWNSTAGNGQQFPGRMLDCADDEVREVLDCGFADDDVISAGGGEDTPPGASAKAAEGAGCPATGRPCGGAGALGHCGNEDGWHCDLFPEPGSVLSACKQCETVHHNRGSSPVGAESNRDNAGARTGTI